MYYWIFDQCCSPECLFHPTVLFIFSYVYIFVNTIFECLYVFRLRKRPSINYVSNWWGEWGVIQNVCSCVQVGGVSHLMCTYALTLFMFLAAFLSDSVLFYLQKCNLTFIRKRCARQKRLFFSNEINFCCHETSFFYLKLFC